MNTEQFLEECNKSPLLKNYRPVTNSLMEEADFFRENYTIKDIVRLANILFFIHPETIKQESSEYINKNREHKDMIHLELIKKYDNKKLIRQYREELKMPYVHKGFRVLKRFIPEIGSFTTFNLDVIHPDYKKWFFSWEDNYNFPQYYEEYDKLMAISPLVVDKVFKTTTKALKKWELPWRYFDAIRELILFNAIIPAGSGIVWSERFYDARINRKPRLSLSFDIDTTKEELIEAIKKDECGAFKNRGKYMIGKIRRTRRKPKETEKMLEIYNKYKKEGISDNKIFSIIQNTSEFRHLSLSAIRDRIRKN